MLKGIKGDSVQVGQLTCKNPAPDVLKKADGMSTASIQRLKRLISIQSVSARNEGLEMAAAEVERILKEIGCSTRRLRLKGYPPLVYGEVISGTNPDRCLLFYNHYDVQPEEPQSQWRTHSFRGVVRGGRVYGRGASDDKGEFIARVAAVEAMLKSRGDVPCTIKFIVEGQEEVGSIGIGDYLKKYRSLLQTNGIIWEFGWIDTLNRPVISLGMKGLLYVELTAHGPSYDLHSSFAPIIENPAWRLVRALATMRNQNGRITINGWYRDIRPLSQYDKELVRKMKYDVAGIRADTGVRALLTGSDRVTAAGAHVSGPTCNIAGLVSGYAGKGEKTVLPSTATVKIDFRLVPNMNPKTQLVRLKAHLKSHGFQDIDVSTGHMVHPSRTNPRDPLVEDVVHAADHVWGDHITAISDPGTGPMYEFSRILKAPCIAIGCTYVGARVHSPNEFIKIDHLKRATRTMILIMDRFGRKGGDSYVDPV